MTFWRVQQAMDPLSRSFRSHIHDGSGYEAGTSCASTLAELIAWAHAYPIAPYGDIEIIEFDGDEIELGSDGEPIVIPSHEIARYGHLRWPQSAWLRCTAQNVDDLLRLGWTVLEPEEVRE